LSNHEIISGDIKPAEAAVPLVRELDEIAPERLRVREH
jgi:hypothetical protein